MTRWLVLGCFVMLMCGVTRAQEAAVAQFSARNQSPLVGEPVQLTLTARFSSGAALVEWPSFPEQWANFEVHEVGELKIADQNGTVEYQQHLTVILWEPGDYATPETAIVYSDATGTLGKLYIPALPFTVPSVLTDDFTLRPLKPLAFMTYIPPVWIAVGVFALAFPIVWFAQRRSKPIRVAGDSQGDIRELDRRTLALLSSIERQALEPAAVYAAAADCLRDYLAQQFQVAAHELTTGELLAGVQPYLAKQSLVRLGQLLGQADLVKFARQIPNREAAQKYLETAAHWIQAAADDAVQRDKRTGG